MTSAASAGAAANLGRRYRASTTDLPASAHHHGHGHGSKKQGKKASSKSTRVSPDSARAVCKAITGLPSSARPRPSYWLWRRISSPLPTAALTLPAVVAAATLCGGDNVRRRSIH